MDEATRQRIQGLIEDNSVLLFMKGTRAQPQCGFSARVVSILETLGPEYSTVNVLSDPTIREGIKEFSDWPTIPQLYVKGEFIGGCDIVTELYDSGELEEKLGVQLADVAPPEITVTERAASAFREALQSGDEFVRLEISPKYEHALSVGSRQGKDVAVEASGLTILLDRASAQRAKGLTVDFVDSPNGPAFKIDNPNEPPRVKAMSPADLKRRLDAGDELELFDVRTPEERAIAHIGGRLLDRNVQQEIMNLPKDSPLVFYCHHGQRSQQAAEFFLSQGFTNVWNVAGGIDAWSQNVDPGVARY